MPPLRAADRAAILAAQAAGSVPYRAKRGLGQTLYTPNKRYRLADSAGAVTDAGRLFFNTDSARLPFNPKQTPVIRGSTERIELLDGTKKISR